MNQLLAAAFVSAFLFIQCYISGTRLAFSLPAYGLIAAAGIAAAFAVRSVCGNATRASSCATAILFSYILARAMASPVDYLARADLYMVLACLVVYGLTVRHFSETKIRTCIIAAMFTLAIAEVLVGLWQFSQKDDWMPFGLVRNPGETRASGMFISSIHFAGYLEAVGPFALAVMAWGTRNRGARLLSGCVALLCYFGVVISGSRGGWLSSLFSLAVFMAISLFLVYRTNRARLPAFIYLGAVTVIAAGVGIIALMERSEMLRSRMDLVSRITAVASGDEKAAPYDVRIYNWQAALDQWRLSPWLGTGAGTHLYYGRLFRRPQLQSDPEHAHGDYLELLAEYGIVGAIGMVLFIAAHLHHGVRRFLTLVQQRAENPYAPSLELAINLGALTAVSAYLAHSVVDFNLHLPGNALLFAFIFGILATVNSMPVLQEEAAEPVKYRFFPGGLALMAVAASLLYFSVAKLPGEYWCEKTRVAARDGRYEEAVESGARALSHEKQNPYIYYHIGQANRLRAAKLPRGGRTESLNAAENAYRAGLELFPQDEDLWIRLGQTLDELGDYRNARDAYLKALENDPNLGLAHAYFAKHLQRVGREAEAAAAKKRARELGDLKTSKFYNTHLADPDSREEQPR